MNRIRLDLSYDGSGFHGWAAQPGLRTVEGVLTEALETILRRQIRLTVAGRTDAGVHAAAQTAHFDVEDEVWQRVPGRSSRTPGEALLTRLTGVMARGQVNRGIGDIVIARVEQTSSDFDARFSAVGRRYRYRIDDRPVPDVFARTRALRSEPLDDRLMMRAGAGLVGEHDFLSFCKPREGATTIRTLRGLDVHRPGSGPDAGLLVLDLEADAFCHSMVRSIVGTLVEIGRGRRDPVWAQKRLAERSRSEGVVIAPAHGLTLEGVEYPDESRYAQQAEQARRVRENPLTPSAARIDPVGCCD
ncbi:tRNA pseudouridine(38-40) synthase TruA [Flaviflexus salsibiostraticola]|uniref:tRNA pseudouridine synthase A n=1 Tax=Flaviflexus salsibiostraticola TaxID=1282737 RepID=A0A3S8ZBX1_9ACTO|nr:tRNA pseudouridine(38-40) synthase TruA [Flaviflexus salsibiostraticola]AZN30982.1 tRNA pseudouridine(38-40) synthase TruA [Flaviflexus salsibiostraticola]